ncbi:hypothetical protein TNCT_117851 [Trichonephila clavata]|uniref:Uncharacterized protein n=1 Tax=Trichonephila clavata TaxID=2740835 RepID=A0A8X6J7P2_TRICU|nr:hypothetical protein TNCT_117851 [Trichonephila clavata]
MLEISEASHGVGKSTHSSSVPGHLSSFKDEKKTHLIFLLIKLRRDLAKGTYDEPPALPGGVGCWAACNLNGSLNVVIQLAAAHQLHVHVAAFQLTFKSSLLSFTFKSSLSWPRSSRCPVIVCRCCSASRSSLLSSCLLRRSASASSSLPIILSTIRLPLLLKFLLSRITRCLAVEPGLFGGTFSPSSSQTFTQIRLTFR